VRAYRISGAAGGHVAQTTPQYLTQVYALLDMVVFPSGMGGYTMLPRTGRVDDEDAWEWRLLHIAARALTEPKESK
jgi:hypothetical protein